MKTFVNVVAFKRAVWTVAGVVSVVCFSAGNSLGEVLIHEPFDYVSGELDAVSGSKWTAVSSAGSNPALVIGGVVRGLDAGSTAMEDNAISFGSTATMLFYGLDVSFTGASLPLGHAYFAALRDGVTEVARLFVRAPALGEADSFRIGIGQNISGDGGTVNSFSNLAFGTVYRVIVGYNPGSGWLSMWINDETNGSIGSLAGATSQIDSFVLRQGGNTTNSYSGLNVDNLTVATTFAEAQAVPEPTTWLMMTLGAAGLLVGKRISRKRH